MSLQHQLYFRLVQIGGESQVYSYENADGGVVSLAEPTEYSDRDTQLVVVDEATLLEAQQCVSGCEHCADSASITFDYLLDEVTGCDPTVTTYVMAKAAICPACSCAVTERTRVVVG